MSVPGTDLQGWAWLRGRGGRVEYWLWTFVFVFWNWLFATAGDVLAQQVLAWAFWLQAVRRLHDAGHSGWWIAGGLASAIVATVAAGAFPGQPLWSAAPGVLVLAGLITMGVLPGSPGDNRFGPPPGHGRKTAIRAEGPIGA